MQPCFARLHPRNRSSQLYQQQVLEGVVLYRSLGLNVYPFDEEWKFIMSPGIPGGRLYTITRKYDRTIL